MSKSLGASGGAGAVACVAKHAWGSGSGRDGDPPRPSAIADRSSSAFDIASDLPSLAVACNWMSMAYSYNALRYTYATTPLPASC